MGVDMKIFGGRPMVKIGSLFFDHIEGKEVNLYKDSLGRLWMANHKWSWFRVKKDGGSNDKR
jgi:hypothetical protein